MEILVETERLILRELVAADAPAIFDLDSDPEVHQFLGNQPLKHIEEALPVIQFIRKQYLDYGIGRWAVVEKESGELIGWSGFKLIRDVVNGHTNYYDLGYRFMRKAWGRGYATESARAMVDYAFNQMDLDAIYAIADVNNMDSRKVLEKSGMKCKGTFLYDDLPHHWFEQHKASL